MDEDEFTWHGWGLVDLKTDKSFSLNIGYLPQRKSPALYASYTDGKTDGPLQVLAYFRDEQAARGALALLDRLMETKNA